jgi:hypothetical protein
MKYLFKLLLVCSLVFGFGYTFAYKPNDDRLHCKVCNDTHFVPSAKITKFIGDMDNRTITSGIFYKCAHCGALTDIKLKYSK